jgi:hypothetical protein
MRNRIDILKDILQLKGDLTILQKEISGYPWDCEIPLITVTKTDIVNILNKCANDEISLGELTNWANIIECRDDLDFENEKIQDLIFELANPEINAGSV